MFSIKKHQKIQLVMFIAIFSLVSMSLLGITKPAFATYFGYDTWLDVDKIPGPGEDDLMCWAAAASNILAWGNWGTSTFSTNGAIFQNFQDHWTDQGGLMDIGWQWWLNGTFPPGYPYGPNWSRVDVTGGGNHWPGVAFSDYYHENWIPAQSMGAIDNYLHAGYGVTIAVYYYYGGHALTVWGYEYDETGGYNGIYVTDSDDYLTQLAYYPVSWNVSHNWWDIGGGFGGSLDWHIGGVEALGGVIPEPGTILLLGAGLVGLVGFGKRRRK